jgi:autotransporter strand-loop-strand O-heptosyltransferase
MPESYNIFKSEIKEYFKHHVPSDTRILDVGPGIGTYSNLLRDLGYPMDCIEIWEPYVHEYNLYDKYDNVHIGNIIDFDISQYDYIILGDVLEHIDPEVAQKLINSIVDSGKQCLVAVPYEMEQGEYYGNVHETHLQADLTHAVMKQRYPQLTELYSNQYYGYYISKDVKYDRAFVLYATESYLPTLKGAVESIKTFSNTPVIVYLLNSDCIVEQADLTIKWECDIEDTGPAQKYIDRSNKHIYKMLIERPAIVKDALLKYAKIVAYVDSDSVATQYVDNIFNMYDHKLNFPYFTEGIYDYLMINGRGGAETRDDMSTTLEAPACELFGVNQYIRQRYRQTGYFVASHYCFDFLNEWYEMCNHTHVINNHEYYAPYHEETIANVLLWKWQVLDGLPLVYSNAKEDRIDFINNTLKWGRYISPWFRLPSCPEELLFLHGEKNYAKMLLMLGHLQKKSSGPRIMFIAPHLSTGGMPAFLLKSIDCLNATISVVEYQCHSLDYVVQRNVIKEIVGDSFATLFENKMELFNYIKGWKPDIIHIHEPSERLDREMVSELYREDRTYKIVETCHDISFNHDQEKIFHPDAYYFCTPYHLETFASSPSYKEVIEFPIDDKRNDNYLNPFDTSKINVVNVGLWTPGKNQAEGIEIARKYPDMNFHFIGNQAANFKDYWEPLMKNLPPNVKVWGEKRNPEMYMRWADIFMFNSTWECNPLVLREAISFGKPIIARNLPQYGSMFDKYIQPIDSDLHSLQCNYIVPTDNTSPIFWDKQKAFYNKVMTLDKQEQDVHIYQNFVNGPFLEIKAGIKAKFKVEFYEEGNLVYDNTINSNCWVRLNKQYYSKWESKVYLDGKLVHHNILNLEGKRVYIAIESKSLGDTIAWVPYALEFQKKHNCKVIMSSFWNKILDIPEIELVEPGSVVPNIYAQYNIGWFYDANKEPVLPNTIKLQEAATKILDLEFQEIMPKLKYDASNNKYGKYVTIATNSTAGCKFWTREGWQELINYLVNKGYKIVNVSKENNPFDNCEKIDNTSIENTMAVIHHSEFFIGLSSGLSWLAWALGKQVVMISNFTEDDHEFECIRVTNKSVCHGCWNNPNFKFDRGDYDWCPINKNTPRHFECHRSISADDVIKKLPV